MSSIKIRATTNILNPNDWNILKTNEYNFFLVNRAKANNYTGYSFISVLFVSNQPTNIPVGSYSMGGTHDSQVKEHRHYNYCENASSHLPVALPQNFKPDLMMLCTPLRRRAGVGVHPYSHSHVYIACAVQNVHRIFD